MFLQHLCNAAFLRWYFIPCCILCVSSVFVVFLCSFWFILSFKCVYRMFAEVPYHYFSLASLIQAYSSKLYICFDEMWEMFLILLLFGTNPPFPTPLTTSFCSFSWGLAFLETTRRAGMKLGSSETLVFLRRPSYFFVNRTHSVNRSITLVGKGA